MPEPERSMLMTGDGFSSDLVYIQTEIMRQDRIKKRIKRRRKRTVKFSSPAVESHMLEIERLNKELEEWRKNRGRRS